MTHGNADTANTARIDFRATKRLKDQLDAMAHRTGKVAADIARKGLARELERLAVMVDRADDIQGTDYRMCDGCGEWVDQVRGEFQWHTHNGREYKGVGKDER